MVSEYFIEERLGKLYDELERIQDELEELRNVVFLDDPEYVELCMIHDFVLEKINLLRWVLGDVQNQINI